jgi:hypothetical protein
MFSSTVVMLVSQVSKWYNPGLNILSKPHGVEARPSQPRVKSNKESEPPKNFMHIFLELLRIFGKLNIAPQY